MEDTNEELNNDYENHVQQQQEIKQQQPAGDAIIASDSDSDYDYDYDYDNDEDKDKDKDKDKDETRRDKDDQKPTSV